VRPAAVLALIALAGCGGSTAPSGTGAKEAARTYFEALTRADDPAAYSQVAAESRKRVNVDRFAALARTYRQGLGFHPAAVHVTSCDERGDTAIAHVTLTGAGSHRHRYKDAVTLRREPDGWRVELAATFGRPVAR